MNTTRASAGFFRSLAFLYRERARILRSPEPMTARQRELMAKLFDSLATNAEEVAQVLQRLQDLPPDEKFSFRRRHDRLKKK